MSNQLERMPQYFVDPPTKAFLLSLASCFDLQNVGEVR